MHLIQLLLPLYDNQGAALPRNRFDALRKELVEQFGGVTSYARAPAHGIWKDEDDKELRDELITIEVMVEDFDRRWWQAFRDRQEKRFEQCQLVVRAFTIDII